jgi:hypothetical protein
MSSIFTISLDFELHWGGFEKWPLHAAKKAYFQHTRQLIPHLLQCFDAHGIHATWATVGLLMHHRYAEIKGNLPEVRPAYHQKELSAYHYLDTIGIGADEAEDPYHYAGQLLGHILATPGQEVGTHTFAHYYCNEPGQTPETFRHDLRAAHKAAQAWGVSLASLVFPRNQFNAEYLRVCREENIHMVRTNPSDWWWDIQTSQESVWKRFHRGLDAYFDIGGKTSFPLASVHQQEGVWLLPASRLLRPYRPKEGFLNMLKINRIKSEMTRAAQSGEIYHLWWHPHNFGNFPQQNMKGLVEILAHYRMLQEKYGMESKNMGEITALLVSSDAR